MNYCTITPSALKVARWIAAPFNGTPHSSVPAPYLRTEFEITEPVSKAILFVAAFGLYECEINGQRVGVDCLTPGWTDYQRRVVCRRYDVTALMRSGRNALGALLGDGWYCGHIGWLPRQIYGAKPALLAALEIELQNGSKQIVSTQNSWKVSLSPIGSNDLLMGEVYDARNEQPGWSSPHFDESAWLSAVIVDPSPEPIVHEPLTASIRRQEEIRPIKKDDLGWPLGFRYDFGQNFAGRVRVRVKATRGTTFSFYHAEALNPDGSLHRENLRKALSTDFYTCKGDGQEEVWEPRFTFHGFRYLEVVGNFHANSAPPELLDVTGIVLHSEMERTGHFSCSNPLLNQLFHNIVWSQKSNFMDVPMDCPQRSERLGWTGDAQIFIRTSAFIYDVKSFFRKWMLDMADAQGDRGGIPAVVPQRDLTKLEDGGPGWSDAAIICPWTIYQCYGDLQQLAESYPMMERWLAFVLEHRCEGFIRTHPDVDKWGYGDWLAMDGYGKRRGGTPQDLIGTAYLALDTSIMAKVASLLDSPDRAQYYETLHQSVVKAFRQRFVAESGLLVSETQTAYALALSFDLLDNEHRPVAAARLAKDIQDRDYHLSTGFLGTSYLLGALSDNAHLDVAYRLLEQQTFPSWLFPVLNGATTVWERWDGFTPEKGFQDASMNSFNHYAYGAVGSWMIRNVAGLEIDPDRPGYRHIIFKPRPGGSLTWAEASLKTQWGKTEIRWELERDCLVVRLSVPEGCTATLCPPEGYVGFSQHIATGTHRVVLNAN